LEDIPGGEGVDSGTLGLTLLQRGSSNCRIHCLSNPCTFTINETVIGITSTDILFHISAEETNANLEPGSRLKRIAQHLLQQRSFYPLFPPPSSKPTNIDLKHMKQWQMPCQPDVLIVPSKLTTFASTALDSTVVVNPGHLTRGTTGGTYAIMEIYPFTRETLETEGGDDVQLPHRLTDRVRVQIKRI
jgi:DNA polymerase alpha subunit B